MTWWEVSVKFAVTFCEEVTVTEVELALGSVIFEPLQPENIYPVAGMEEMLVVSPWEKLPPPITEPCDSAELVTVK